MTPLRAGGLWAVAVTVGLLLAGAAFARDAAFMQPATIGAGEGAIKVEPKEDIDAGETIIGVPKRVTLFFVNQSSGPVQVEKIELNSDGDVTAEKTNDDCTKQGSIAPGSRCSIEISVTPTSPGPWSAEVLMTHDGAGHIAHAKLSGKTTGTVAEKKDMGLTMNAKEVTPVTFGDVQVGDKAIRSALMINDSPDPITLYSVDVIEAENGLQRLDEGCAVDMELKPGESCPVTLVWSPVQPGQVSTDLIIRHSGRLGFAVIPLRGKTVEAKPSAVITDTKSDKTADTGKLPPPPGAEDIEKAAAGKITPVGVIEMPKTAPSADLTLHLIGTIGNRAVLLLPDSSTKMVSAGEEETIDDKTVKVTAVMPKSVTVVIDGKKKELILGASEDLEAKAVASEAKEAKAEAVKAAIASIPPVSGKPMTSLTPAAVAASTTAKSTGISATSTP